MLVVRELEVRRLAAEDGACRRTAAVERPERKPEDDDVRQPEDTAAHQQLRPCELRALLRQQCGDKHAQPEQVPQHDERDHELGDPLRLAVVRHRRGQEQCRDEHRLRHGQDNPQPLLETQQLPVGVRTGDAKSDEEHDRDETEKSRVVAGLAARLLGGHAVTSAPANRRRSCTKSASKASGACSWSSWSSRQVSRTRSAPSSAEADRSGVASSWSSARWSTWIAVRSAPTATAIRSRYQAASSSSASRGSSRSAPRAARRRRWSTSRSGSSWPSRACSSAARASAPCSPAPSTTVFAASAGTNAGSRQHARATT